MKYKIIYADPPWSFKVWSKKGAGRSAEKHYKTMTKNDIQNLDINSISDNDSILFLWVTAPCLQEGLELISKWGFVYKTIGFVWIKKNKKNTLTNFWGMGYWTRANAELCLIATKGKIARIHKGVHQVIETPIEIHSKKPDEVRSRIVKLIGELPRVELFARTQAEGWDVFGNEVENSIKIPFKNTLQFAEQG